MSILRPSGAVTSWFVRPSSGAAQWSVTFGESGDVPLATTK
jgi:hypothetical protein